MREIADVNATGKKLARGVQGPAIVSGNPALTSTHLPDGGVTSEVAGRKNDGTWLWVIDKMFGGVRGVGSLGPSSIAQHLRAINEAGDNASNTWNDQEQRQCRQRT